MRSLLDLRAGDWLDPIDPNQPTEGYVTSDAQVRELIEGARLVAVEHRHAVEVINAVWEYVDEVPDLDPSWNPELPFPATYIAAPVNVASHGVARTRLDLLGLLVADDVLFAHTTMRNGDQALVELVALGVPRYKESPADKSAIVTFMLFANALCHATMLAGTTVVRVPGAVRRKLERTRREAPHAPIPRDYYTVRIEERLRWEGIARDFLVEQGPCYRVGYRHDVRAHPRLLVERGDLVELDAKRFKTLAKRGYTVWTGREDDPVDDALDELLRKRGVRRAPSGYLAARRVQVASHIRGPADRPYVPAAWRLRTAAPNIVE